MEILSKIIDFLNDKFSLPVAAFCCFLLFVPDWILVRLNLAAFAYSYNEIISLTLIFSAILYLYGKGKKISRYIKSKSETRSKRRAHRKIIIKHVQGLTDNEKAWIYYCLRKKVLTLYAADINGTAVAMESKHLIYRPKSVYDKSATPFTFFPEVWKYLNKKKDKFCTHERIRDRQYNEEVEKFVKNLRGTE